MNYRLNFIALTMCVGMLSLGCSDDDPAPTGPSATALSASDLGFDWTGRDETLSLDSSTGRFQHSSTAFGVIGGGTWTIDADRLTLNYEQGDDFLISGMIVLTASLNGQDLTLIQLCDEISLDDADSQQASVANCEANPTNTWTR